MEEEEAEGEGGAEAEEGMGVGGSLQKRAVVEEVEDNEGKDSQTTEGHRAGGNFCLNDARDGVRVRSCCPVHLHQSESGNDV
jgi:hypothetical protein